MNKFFVKSKTIWGLTVAFAIGVLPVLGVSFTAEDSVLFTELFDSILQTASLAFAAYGRVVASAPLTVTQE